MLLPLRNEPNFIPIHIEALKTKQYQHITRKHTTTNKTRQSNLKTFHQHKNVILKPL